MQIGDTILMRDCLGDWYEAEVTDNDLKSKTIFVHYKGVNLWAAE